jgi:hypothetical protein
MAFLRVGLGGPPRGTGLPSPIEEGHTSLCLNLVAKWLNEVANTYDEMFENTAPSTSPAPIKVVEGDAAESIDSSNLGLTIGEEKTIYSDAVLSVIYKRIGESAGTIEYRTVNGGELVLARDISETGGITEIDPAFWTIDLDGACASSSRLDAAMRGEHLEKVDHCSRTIRIKTPH